MHWRASPFSSVDMSNIWIIFNSHEWTYLPFSVRLSWKIWRITIVDYPSSNQILRKRVQLHYLSVSIILKNMLSLSLCLQVQTLLWISGNINCINMSNKSILLHLWTITLLQNCSYRLFPASSSLKHFAGNAVNHNCTLREWAILSKLKHWIAHAIFLLYLCLNTYWSDTEKTS